MTIFALISDTKLVSPKDLYYLTAPLEVNARHCAEAWGLVPPSVVVIDDMRQMSFENTRNVHPVVFTGSEHVDGRLAEHWWSSKWRGPAARVYVDGRSELRLGQYSLAESAGHEIVESMVDPRVDMWAPWPGVVDGMMALEVADMTQDTYEVEVGGTKWPMANFVTPDYFDARLIAEAASFLKSGGRFDKARRMRSPGQILPTGYAMVRYKGQKPYPIYGGSGLVYGGPGLGSEIAAKAKRHPWARSALRGCRIDGAGHGKEQEQGQGQGRQGQGHGHDEGQG